MLEAGRQSIASVSPRIVLIDPNEPVQAVVTVHDLLSRLSGTVRICDPYVDAATLEHLDCVSPGQKIELLTANIRDSGKFRRMLSALLSKGLDIEIRKTGKKDIHDRYVVDDSMMVIFGSSLNGIGKKQSFVIQAGEDVRGAVLAAFASRWRKATPWP